MARVSGIVRSEDGTVVTGAVVRASDKDMRSEQLLGEGVSDAGHYAITYTEEQFHRAEKKQADLILRAFDEAGNLRVESDIVFNAHTEEQIDLTFTPLPPTEPRRLSELETLQETIAPVLEGVEYRDFTDRDLVFLSHEATRQRRLPILEGMERRTLHQRLGFLRLADQFADQTDILLAAFYGWFRILDNRLFELDELLDLPTARLREALEEAIAEHIIPDISQQIPEILEILRSLRFERGRLVNHRFVARLIGVFDDGTEQPLASHLVDVVDLDAETEEQASGTVQTDGRGILVLTFSLTGNAPEDAVRRLQLMIHDDGAPVAATEIEAHAHQEEVAEIRVQVREDERGDVDVEEVAPPELAARLRQRGINSLHDLLVNPDVTDEDDPEGLERLRGHLRFAVLASELGEDEREELLEEGHRGLPDVAAISRAKFVREHHERLGGDAAAYITREAAMAYRQMAQHMNASAWLKIGTSPDDEPDDPDIPTGVQETLKGLRKCGCKDCESAVSPAAYLAHLLDWTLEHVKDVQAPITLRQLEDAFHQPFREMPASCEAVEEQVRQVRICIEVLWRFTGLRDLTELQMPTPFRTGYRFLRNQLYRQILLNLGVSYDQLRLAQLQPGGTLPAGEAAARQRETIAGLLGIDPSHLASLFFRIEQPPVSPSEADLSEIFGYEPTNRENLFEPLGRPDLVTWQHERLEEIWQQQDWPNDAYSGAERLPFVDPAIIDEAYLRAIEPNPALDLLVAREETVANHRQALVDSAPQPDANDLVALLTSELGQPVDVLRAHYDTLQAAVDSVQIAQAHADIATLGLTPAGFAHLMETDAHLQNGEPLAPTDEEVAAAWDAVLDILSRAFRHRLFPDWVVEEDAIGLILGPELFWLPLEPPAQPNPWQASVAERTTWEDALRRRSRRPVIDPDQMSRAHIKVFRLIQLFFRLGHPPSFERPPLDAYELWQERRTWVDDRLDALQQARQGQATGMDTLQAVMEASTVGVGLELFGELADLEAQGGDLQPRLDQLGLTLLEYRFLARIHQLAQNESTIASHEWRQVGAILIQAEKKREFAEWRLEEQAAGIFLRPLHFNLLKEPPNEDDDPQRRWLHDARAYEEWDATLRSRYEQFDTLRDALNSAVGDAEAQVLPLLRNLLIMHSTAAPGDSLAEKADWLDKRLLIDPYMDGCHMTTRVSQAIETLQRFIRGVYTQEHQTEMQHLTLDAVEDYEAEWPVLGSYATCRAYMLAYLYPENLLHVSPPGRQSYGFEQLMKQLPTRPTPEAVCSEARAYGEYFRDVCNLEVQATCQIKTFVGEDETCEPLTTSAPSTLHLFARAQTSGAVYWAKLDPSKEFTDTTTSWEPVHKLGMIERIFGATPHFTPNGRRFVLLFFSVRKLGKMELRFAKYDVDRLYWSNDVDLGLPSGGEDGFSAAIIQKRGANPDFQAGDLGFPTLLAVKPEDGPIYINQLNQNAVNWESGSWKPLFGPRMVDSFGEVLALIQRTSNEYVILANGIDYGMFYRFLYLTGKGRDDLTWSKLFSEGYNGGFSWFSGTATFLFYRDAGTTKYRRLGAAGPIEPENESKFRYHYAIDADERQDWARQVAEDIVRFNDEWLEPHVGVSLRDFEIPDFRPNFFVPHKDTGPHFKVTAENTVDPLNPDRENVKEIEKEGRFLFSSFNLNLLELFSYELKGMDISIPEDARFRYKSLDFYLIQLQHQYVQEFLKFIANIDSAQILEGALGRWKFADEQIRRFSYEGLSLADLIERFLENIVYSYLDFYTLGVYPTKSTSFRERDTNDEKGGSQTASSDTWIFVPTSGDERTPGLFPKKAVVVQMRNGPFWTPLRRDSDELSGRKMLNLAPHGSGPFNLLPERDTSALEQRRADIELMYKPLLSSTPSVMMYLKEAYNLVPLYLGHALQRGGRYEEALLWYRQVLDYLQPFDQGKIDYSLRHEEKLAYEFDNAQEWLNDASNPHAVAATRKNTYTRHVLLMIIRCLIDYGDRLFSHDNVTDNARARELYIQALRLLDSKLLRPGKSPCSDIIGQLEVEVVEPGHLPLDQFKIALAQIQDPDRLRDVVDSLQTISQDTDRPAVGRPGGPPGRLEAMRETVTTALADLPAPKPMVQVLDDKRELQRTLENHYLAHRPARALLQKSFAQSRQASLSSLANVTDMTEETLLRERPALPWLRRERSDATGDGNDLDRPNLVLLNPGVSPRLAVLRQIRNALPLQSLAVERRSSFAINSGLTFDFCIPQNPVITALRTRVQNNLTKLRQCRNIAGMVRQLDPYGAPIGIGAGMVSPDGTIFSGIVAAPPTPYRYAALITRAKELVNIAQQIEAGYQAALESAERKTFSAFQAEQGVELANARVVLGDLRVNQANNELGLAQLQKGSAVLREETYAGWIAAGKNEHERNLLQAYRDAGEAQQAANAARTVAQVAGYTAAAIESSKVIENRLHSPALIALRSIQAAAAAAEGVATGFAINAQTRARVESFEASFERRNDEWQLQQGLAALDVQIGDQQIQLARGGIAIAQQERATVGLEQTLAVDTVKFLRSESFNEEMYRWIAGVLEDVYRFFLQAATAIARLAERQLAFERQQGALKLIQSDYWNARADGSGATGGTNVDRLGLTGSARLLKDIYQLDNYAFETRRRKQALTLTLDLAEMFPVEFQHFRETGVLVFETPLSLIDRQMPGYYLCLIQQVTVSVVALIPPSGIRATLKSAGPSRVVVSGDTFQKVMIHNLPDSIALTAPTTSSAGILELEPDA